MAGIRRCQNAVYRTRKSLCKGYVESFIGKLRDELLYREIFCTLFEAQVLFERWRREYNNVRPHSSLGYVPPEPEAILPTQLQTKMLQVATRMFIGGFGPEADNDQRLF